MKEDISKEVLSIIAISIGRYQCRATLFDIVDQKYRLVSSVTTESTAFFPERDISIGIMSAIKELSRITGREFMDDQEEFIIPSDLGGSGIDSVIGVISAGNPIDTVLMAVDDDISLQSSKRYAGLVDTKIVDSMSIFDIRSVNEVINQIRREEPELIIISGGIEGGITEDLMKTLLEPVGLVSYLLTEEQKPEVIYCGDSTISAFIDEHISHITKLSMASNIRPQIDQEDIDSAIPELISTLNKIYSRKYRGIENLLKVTDGYLLPSSIGFRRSINYLNQTHKYKKWILGIEADREGITTACAKGEYSFSKVNTSYSIGAMLLEKIREMDPAEISQWLPFDISDNKVSDFIANKALNPTSVPVTDNEAYMEQALIRWLISRSLKDFRSSFPIFDQTIENEFLEVEPLIISGNMFSQTTNLAQIMLTVLDSVQPCGVTTVILDQASILGVLGVVAEVNPDMAVQVIDSDVFQHLGSVISPVGSVLTGSPIMKLSITPENEDLIELEIKEGDLEVIDIPSGTPAEIHLQPFPQYDVGMGKTGLGGRLKVLGGVFGVIIDARGRPLRLLQDKNERIDHIDKWLWKLGG